MKQQFPAINQTCQRITVLLVILASLLIFIGMLATADSQAAAAQGSTAGTIAYVHNQNELRLIEPDGSNDRPLWAATGGVFGISDLDWKQDATELAFASDHQLNCSIFQSDIYAVGADGSNLRRLTNAPTCGALAGYAKGDVTITIQNFSSSSGPYFVYIQGAPTAQQVSVPANDSVTLTINNVADLGDVFQQAVVIEGLNRWDAPLAAADVQAGQTVDAGTLSVTGFGLQNYGAFAPSWHSSGSRLGFTFGECSTLVEIESAPPPASRGVLLLDEAVFEFGCVMDWRPLSPPSDEFLYWSYLKEGIYLGTAGSSDLGTKLVTTGLAQWVWGVTWLPDESGFLFSLAESVLTNANVYRYDFASNTVSQLTFYNDQFTRDLTVSPDGQFIVYELATTSDSETADLWMMRQDGSDVHLLAGDGRAPSWSSQQPQIPEKIYVPLLLR